MPKTKPAPPKKPATPQHWIRLQSGNSFCFVEATKIAYVSAAFKPASYAESRQLGIVSGGDLKVYILNSPENYDALTAGGIVIGTPEDWGQPRERKSPRLVRGKTEKPAATAKGPEPGSRAFTSILMRLQDELEKEHKILLTGDNAFFIREAVQADPKVTAAQIAERWKDRKAARA